MKHPDSMISQLTELFGRWEATVRGLTEEQLTEVQNGMSVKGLVAHLMAWQQVSIARMEAAILETEPEFPDWLQGEHPESEHHKEMYNQRIQDEYRETPWSAVHALWRTGFQRFIDAAQRIPESDLLDTEKYPWLEGYSLYDVLEGSYGHHTEHFEELKSRLPPVTDQTSPPLQPNPR